MSAFVLEDGVVYHTYSTYARGLDGLWGMYQWLDRAPKGRNETGDLVAPPRRIRQALSEFVNVAGRNRVSIRRWARCGCPDKRGPAPRVDGPSHQAVGRRGETRLDPGSADGVGGRGVFLRDPMRRRKVQSSGLR